MSLRLLNAADVRALLPMQRCIELMRTAFTLVADGKAKQPIRQSVRPDHDRWLLSIMPGALSDPPWLGIKVVSDFQGNHGTQFSSHQGMVLLFDTVRGTPVAAIDAGAVTAIRTAAATAVATDILAPAGVETLSLFGCGEEAAAHLQSLPLVRRFGRILIWGRNEEKTRAFCAANQASVSVPLQPVASVEDAARQADVLCTLTSAPEPFLRGAWLREGQHLNVVGSSIPSTAEIDVEAVARTRFYADFRDSTLALAGEFRRAREQGVVGDDHVLGSIGDVITGRCVGRRSSQDITLFKSLGMVAEDLVSADFILREAIARDVGQIVQW
jgi:ornithine cyclodeaminase